MVWGYFATSGTGQLTIIDSAMNSESRQRVHEDVVFPLKAEVQAEVYFSMRGYGMA